MQMTQKKSQTKGDNLGNCDILENMKKNDTFIGDVLAPFEQALGMKFNKFNKPEDPKYVEPKKKANLSVKLKQAERKRQKLQKLQKLDPTKAKQMQWESAMNKAKGIKVKDDPKIIKKAMKRKDNEKKKHKKKWAERLEKQEEAKNTREKRKQERIQKAKAGRDKNNKSKKGYKRKK